MAPPVLAAPSGGSITYANTAITKTDQVLSLIVNDGTEINSGIDVTSRLLQRSQAPMVNGVCGTYGDFSTVTYSGSYPNITTTSFEIDHCYKYRWQVSDTTGNQTNYTNDNFIYTSPHTFPITSLAVGTVIQVNDVQFLKANSNNLLLALTPFPNHMKPAPFAYTGDVQTFTIPETGKYKLEVWGAQGGLIGSYRGGYGGYARGEMNFTKGQVLYIYVGGQSEDYSTNGYNGGGIGLKEGGSSQTGGAGGGATHIASVIGLLSSFSSQTTDVFIVGGGGGGGSQGSGTTAAIGGCGGGFQGCSGGGANPGAAGTQSSGCAFGQGCNARSWGGGGGGGYYGGNGGQYASGSGGSGYIGNPNLNAQIMYCNGCATSAVASTLTYTTADASINPVSNYTKSGHGYALISFIPEPVSPVKMTIGDAANYDFTGTYQNFVAPYSGVYQLEVWGAEGTVAGNYRGGYGGYAQGQITLTKGEMLYIYVGGQSSTYNSSGYNGGGIGAREDSGSGRTGSSGGGATHISTKNNVLSTLSANTSDIILVAGGGGGGAQGDYVAIGGCGGGFQGCSGGGANPGAAGTQSSGCAFGQGCNARSWGGGGGGGYYGGNGGQYASGGGGSGYIGNSRLNNKSMYCYNCTTSTTITTLTYSTTNVSAEPTSNYAKSGNGFARITLLSKQ